MTIRIFTGQLGSSKKEGKKSITGRDVSGKFSFMKSKDGRMESKNFNYEDFMKEKMKEYREEMQQKVLAQKMPQLPGTKADQQMEMSKLAQMTLERMAAKRAKKEAKKEKDKPDIRARPFMGPVGGNMDAMGNVYDRYGQLVLRVDKKTGIVTSAGMGIRLGKFNPKSSYCIYRMEQWIAQYSKQGNARNSLNGRQRRPDELW